MLIGIELGNREQQYCEVMKWVAIRSRMKNAIEKIDRDDLKKRASAIYDQVDLLVEDLSSDFVERDKAFIKKIEENTIV